jgi:hypothetical protein
LGYSVLGAILQAPVTDGRDYVALLCFFVIGNGAIMTFLAAYAAAAELVPRQAWVGRATGTVLAAYAAAAALCAFVFRSALNSELVPFFVLLSLATHAISAMGAFSIMGLESEFRVFSEAKPRFPALLPEADSSADAVTAGTGVVIDSAAIHMPLHDAEAVNSVLPPARLDLDHATPSGKWTGATLASPEAEDESGSIMALAVSMVQPAFLAMWLVTFLGLGSALMFVNTVSDVVAASTPGRVDASELTRDCVIAFALCNVGSRMVGGFVSDWSHKHGHSRVWVLVGGCVLGVIAHGLIAVTPDTDAGATQAWLISSSCAVGVSEGLLILWPVVAREWFGAGKTGVMFSLMNSAAGIGSVAFTAVASGTLNTHSETTINADGITVTFCEGRACFAAPFFIASASCLVAAVGGILLIAFVHSHRQTLAKHSVLVKSLNWPCMSKH